jgi:hypothetical protein
MVGHPAEKRRSQLFSKNATYAMARDKKKELESWAIHAIRQEDIGDFYTHPFLSAFRINWRNPLLTMSW